MKRWLLLTLLIALTLTFAFFSSPQLKPLVLSPAEKIARQSNWATPIPKKGLPNLHQLTPNLYRGAQPTAGGMKELEAMGIKTVVNLRWLHSDDDEAKGTSLNLIRIRCQAWDKNLDEEAAQFLKIVTDPSAQPVFVHCKHGADRTGTMCAIYRIAVQGWSVDEALEEMTKGDYNFHEVWKNLPAYLHGLDVDKLRGVVSPVNEPAEEPTTSNSSDTTTPSGVQ